MLSIPNGAIIRLAFNCQTEGMISSGKVKYADEKEVVIVPQRLIVHKKWRSGLPHSPVDGRGYIEMMKTVDRQNDFHIDRSIIAGWEYLSFDRICRMASSDDEFINSDESKSSHYTVNNWGNERFYRGSGEYFE